MAHLVKSDHLKYLLILRSAVPCNITQHRSKTHDTHQARDYVRHEHQGTGKSWGTILEACLYRCPQKLLSPIETMEGSNSILSKMVNTTFKKQRIGTNLVSYIFSSLQQCHIPFQYSGILIFLYFLYYISGKTLFSFSLLHNICTINFHFLLHLPGESSRPAHIWVSLKTMNIIYL